MPKRTVLYMSTFGDGEKRPPESLFLLLVEKKNLKLSLMVFSQFQINFSFVSLLQKVSPHLPFLLGIRCREAFWPIEGGLLPCWILLMPGWPLVSQFWHLSLCQPLPKWLGLFLLEVWTLCVARNTLPCPMQLSLRAHLGSCEDKASESSQVQSSAPDM